MQSTHRSVGDIFSQPYICAIHEGQVYVWDSITGKPQLVFNSGVDYLKDLMVHIILMVISMHVLS